MVLLSERRTDWFRHYVHFPQSCFVAVATPPSPALQRLSNRNRFWIRRSNMRWLRGWLASWQIVYTRSPPLCTRCIACWFVHRLNFVGISVYVTACVYVGVVASGCMCVAVVICNAVYVAHMLSVWLLCILRTSEDEDIFHILRAPNSVGVQALPSTQSTRIYSLILFSASEKEVMNYVWAAEKKPGCVDEPFKSKVPPYKEASIRPASLLHSQLAFPANLSHSFLYPFSVCILYVSVSVALS